MHYCELRKPPIQYVDPVDVTYVVFISFVNEMPGFVVSMVHLSREDPLRYFIGIKDTVLKKQTVNLERKARKQSR